MAAKNSTWKISYLVRNDSSFRVAWIHLFHECDPFQEADERRDSCRTDDYVSDWLMQDPGFEDQNLPILPEAPSSPKIEERDPFLFAGKHERSDTSSDSRRRSQFESLEEKRERVKKRRRESARRSRARKNTYVKSLEFENAELKDENRRLREALAKVDKDVLAGLEYGILELE